MTRHTDSDFGLHELCLYLGVQANLARASVLLGCDRERAGWFLDAAAAAVDDLDVPLDADVLCELRRLVHETVRHWRAGDAAATEGSLALAEGLSLLRILALQRHRGPGQPLIH